MQEIKSIHNYFLTRIFFEIFNENPMATKWMIAPKIAPAIISSNIIQAKINTAKEGTEIITAIIVPRRIISCFVRLIDGFSSDNRLVLKKSRN